MIPQLFNGKPEIPDSSPNSFTYDAPRKDGEPVDPVPAKILSFRKEHYINIEC